MWTYMLTDEKVSRSFGHCNVAYDSIFELLNDLLTDHDNVEYRGDGVFYCYSLDVFGGVYIYAYQLEQ